MIEEEILNERAYFTLKSLNFFRDFQEFDEFSVIEECKRVNNGGYEEEVRFFKLHKKKFYSFRDSHVRMDMKDYISKSRKKVENLRLLKRVKAKLGFKKTTQV